MTYTVDHRLIEEAIKSEGAAICRGTTEDGQRVIVIVAVGANAGLVEKLAREGRLHLSFEEALE